MKVDLADKIALVTGGAHGIGFAIAEQLAANGADVVIVDIDVPAGEVAVKQIRNQGGGRCYLLPADVADSKEIGAVVAEVVDRYGRIDILINNAGINTLGGRAPIHEYAFQDWERIIRVDLTGVFVTTKAVVPHMLGKGGKIVNIGSVAGIVPLRLQSAFVAAKGGVTNLTRSMALELGPLGILVNAVLPGSTLTRGTEALFYGPDGAYTEKAASLVSHIPLGRPAKTEEIAHAVLFLAAPESSYINGAILVVDGGWTAGYMREW